MSGLLRQLIASLRHLTIAHHAVINKSLAVATNGVLIMISAELPGKVRSEPNTEIVESPGTHNHIVDIDIEPDEKHAIAKTLETAL